MFLHQFLGYCATVGVKIIFKTIIHFLYFHLFLIYGEKKTGLGVGFCKDPPQKLELQMCECHHLPVTHIQI